MRLNPLLLLLVLFASAPAQAVLKVGFLDSGMNDRLPRFQKYVIAGTNSGEDTENHGTAVVDLFLRQIERRNIPDIEVLMEKEGDSNHVANKIRALVSAGVSIINMSMSFTFADPARFDDYKNAVDKEARNVLFLISAGDNSERRPFDLGSSEWRWHSTRVSSDHVLVVGGVTKLPDGYTLSTNYGSRVDLMGVLTGFPALGADGNESSREGLSFLIPQYTAQASELLSRNPRLKPKDVISRLKDKTSRVRTIGRVRKDVRLLPTS